MLQNRPLPQSHSVLFHLLQNAFSGKRVAKVLQKRISKNAQSRKPLILLGFSAHLSQGGLFPLDSTALTSHDKPHFECAFRPWIPEIPRFLWGLWNFCSHFVASSLITRKPQPAIQNYHRYLKEHRSAVYADMWLKDTLGSHVSENVVIT